MSPEAGPGGTDSPEEGSGGTDASEEVQMTEKALMVISFGFTVALFAFALWQAVTGAPAPPPSANVTETVRITDDAVFYVVTLRNDGNVGLLSATVTVDCPGPTRTVAFENVPATSHRNATVSCPPGGASPSADVTAWIPG